MNIIANLVFEYGYLLTFINGLAFFILGMLVFFQQKKARGYQIGKAIWLLGIFGIIVAMHEWLNMFLTLKPIANNIIILIFDNLVLLILAFIALLQFPIATLCYNTKLARFTYWFTFIYYLVIVSILNFQLTAAPLHTTWMQEAEQLIRYTLVLPATLLTAILFYIWKKHPEVKEIKSIRLNESFNGAFIFFTIYGLLMGLLALNTQVVSGSFFLNIAPIFKTLCALGIIVCLIRILRMFDAVTNKKLELAEANKIFSHFQEIANIVETKEIFFNGHHQRIAAFAETIAKQMQLPEETIETIKRAALIHDIGKIEVSPEILNRPRALLKEEQVLMQVHPQVGYDLVRYINFPWPIAEIILQHHEYLNGTGYPNKLTGDAICIGAKILAVAEAVEQTLIELPYHKAETVTAAINKITAQKNILYAAAVVDACVTILHNNYVMFPII